MVIVLVCHGLKEPDVMSSSDGANWNEEWFWWYINKIVYDLTCK